jgi:hypothetical protein
MMRPGFAVFGKFQLKWRTRMKQPYFGRAVDFMPMRRLAGFEQEVDGGGVAARIRAFVAEGLGVPAAFGMRGEVYRREMIWGGV